MSLRYYISRILPPDPQPADPEVVWKDYFRVAMDDLNPRPSFAAHIPSLPSGAPAFGWALVYAKATDWSAVDASPTTDNFRLFQTAGDDQDTLAGLLDTLSTIRWSNLTQNRRTTIRNRLQAEGIPVADITNTTSMRAILQKVGRHLHPDFSEVNLHVNGGV